MGLGLRWLEAWPRHGAKKLFQNVNTNGCAIERPQLFQSYTWKGEAGRHGLSRQWDIKLAWCVLLFNWPWNINRFGIHWLTFDWGETEQPPPDVCNWIVAVSADIVSKHCVAYFYLFASFFRSFFLYSGCGRHRHIEWLADCNCANDELCPPCRHCDWCATARADSGRHVQLVLSLCRALTLEPRCRLRTALWIMSYPSDTCCFLCLFISVNFFLPSSVTQHETWPLSRRLLMWHRLPLDETPNNSNVLVVLIRFQWGTLSFSLVLCCLQQSQSKMIYTYHLLLHSFFFFLFKFMGFN